MRPTAISRTAAGSPQSFRAPPGRPCRPSPRGWWPRAAPLATGSAVVTTAGRLPFKGVIHAVGPRYGEGDEENKLYDALTNAFSLALERGWESVSFPAVSSGIFAVPLEICARAYLRAARASPLSNVRLCLRDQPVIDAVLKEMKA
jgi:O-acetyl-ADP-ribose deacetylase (regulator of RNase III)